MIRAMIFDLDGTLVGTERLKALSYALAARELCPECASEDEIIEGFRNVVGRSRQEVATTLVKQFGLEDAASKRMSEFGVSVPWQAYVQVRLQIYNQLIADPEMIKKNAMLYQIALLRKLHKMGYKTGLATTTRAAQTCRVLAALNITNEFDFIATDDDVEHSKPSPEIYFLVVRELGAEPDECLAFEDSPAGVQSALAAGVRCIAVTTDFTRDRIHKANLLDPRWIVDDPSKLDDVVMKILSEVNKEAVL
jgi:HAD superfamily hydrolase (TIGR01509 family)